MSDSPFKTQVRAAVEHLLAASTTLGSADCVRALDMAEFYITKAKRDAETSAERDLLIHLAEAGIAIGKRHRSLLELFLTALQPAQEGEE